MSLFWPENEEKLREYAEGGMSAAQAARALGCSRNAAIGAAARRGLFFNANGSGGRKGSAQPGRPREPRKPAVARPVIVKAAPVPEPDPIGPPNQFPKSGCRWIYGDTRPGGTWQACGNPGEPWCDFHKKKIHQPAKVRT